MPYSRCVRCSTATGSPASCTPSPTPRCSACARRSSTRTSTLLHRRTRSCSCTPTPPGRTVTGSWSSARRRARDATPPTSSWSPPAPPTRPSCCSRSATDKHPNGLANGSDQVGRNYMFHNSEAVLALSQGAEPDGLPEDARAQRLLLLGPRLRLPARQHPDGRQVPGADVPRREAGRDDARPDLVARWTSPRHAVDFWLSTEDLPAAGEPRHASTTTARSRIAYTATNDEPERAPVQAS